MEQQNKLQDQLENRDPPDSDNCILKQDNAALLAKLAKIKNKRDEYKSQAADYRGQLLRLQADREKMEKTTESRVTKMLEKNKRLESELSGI